MQTSSRALLVVVILAAAAVGSTPSAALAEGFGGPCNYVGAGGILPPPTYFNATTGSPFTPKSAEFTDSEALPLSNFTATANWGDGTTTPATIGAESCHQVTAPSHVYARSGAYQFSYTVHDAHTGLDHSIGAETVYIWGTPQRVDSPASHQIHATVGVPWSGVLGEFTEESIPFGEAAYYVRIEWEAGDRVWGTGTVTAGSSGTLVVSGSHVYPAKFDGTATVTVGIAQATSSWPVPVSANQPVPFAFRGHPIIAAIPSVPGRTAYDLIFRVDRPLPRTASGRIEASLGGYGVAGSLASFGRHTTHACYAAGLTISRHHVPHAHRLYPLTLSTQEPGLPTTHGHSALRRYRNFVDMLTRASRELGC